jgi:hypothetical protein
MLHLFIDSIIKTFAFLFVILFDVVIELIIAKFVPFFILAVFGEVLLNCIVGKVYGSAAVTERVFASCGSDVSFLVPVAFEDPVDAGDHDIVSEVEFSLVVEEWSFDVGLDDVCAIGAIIVAFPLFEHIFDFLQSEAHFDAISPIAIFSRFNNPTIIFL